MAIDPVTGKFTYTPTAAARHDAATTGAATAAKTDTFTVTVTDTAGEAATKLVTVKVSPTNATPVKAGPSAGSADTATGVVIGNVGVTDADSDALTYTATPKKGTVSFGPDGSFTYTASAKAMHAASALKAKASDKSETFTVTIKDGHGATVTQVVTVQIAPANVAPTAVSSPVVTKENSSTGAVTGKVSAADGDMDKLTYSGAAAKGKVSVSSSGTFTYTPTSAARHAASADGATDADKTDTVTITANDGHGGLLIQTIDVDIAGKNAKPGSVSTKIGKANADTGVITGTVKATDADKDSLTYSVTPASAKGGSVRIDAATGAFVYTPTAAARNAAAAKNAPKVAKTDTFTVTIADGHGDSVNKVVTVTVSPKASTTQQGGLSVVGSVAIEGKTYNAVFSHDGTRAVVTAVTGDDATGYTTSLTVIDPTTATKRGSAITVSGFLSTVQYSADGTRALVTTTDSVSDATTRLVTINTTTGAQVGTTVVVGGTTSAGVTFSSNGSRAFLVTSASTDNGGSIGSTTRIAVVNTATGVQAGNTVTFSNDYASYNQDGDMIATPNSLQWTSNGTRAVLSTSGYNEDTEDGEIKVAVVDTVNGTVLGGVQTFSGVLYSDVQLSVDSTRAAVAINSLDGSSAATVKLVNLVTGAVSATQITQSGIIAAAQFTPDSTRLVVNTTAYGAEPSTFTTYIGVYNAASGAQIAAPVTMSGVSVAPASFNASGTRAVVTVDTFNSAATSPADQISSVGVVVINTATGAKVGSIVTVPGSPLLESRISAVPWVPVQVNADGSRALITTVSGDDTHGYTTRIALVDTATGAKVGSTVTAVGTTRIGLDMHLPAFSADGTRAVVTTFVGDETSGYTTHIAVLNTVTGAQLGGVVTLAGGIADNNFSLVQFNTDGTRAVIATNAGDWDTGFTGQVALLNTATGGQLGALKNYADDSPIVAMFSGDGTRLYVNGESYADMSGASTYFAVFDAATGNQIGSTLSYIGTQSAIMVTNADTTLGLAHTTTGTEETGFTTTVTLVDLKTATVIGTPVVLSGDLDTLSISDDGRRAIVGTATGSEAGGYTTTVTMYQIGVVGAAPTNATATVGTPNASTGVVTGTVTATDADGNPLTYRVAADATKGVVALNASTGAFTFTPTVAARHAALTSDSGAANDTFTVAISDGTGNSTALTVTVPIKPGSNAPVTSASATVGTPNSATGVVTGTVTATDADGDTLTFSGPASTGKGTLTVSGASGAFTYTPTVAARQAAAAPGAVAADKKDTFTITVSDGHGSSVPVNVTVTIAPAATNTATSVANLGSVTVAGQPNTAAISSDGSRAIVTTMTSDGNTLVAVINTATGAKVGTGVTVSGSFELAAFNAGGSRAVVVGGTSVALIDTTTGQQVGNAIASGSSGYAEFSPDGSRLAVMTFDSSSAGHSTWRVIDSNTGTQVGSSVSGNTGNDPVFFAFSADSSRTVVMKFQRPASVNNAADWSTQITVFSTATGTQVGNTISRTGFAIATPNSDGSKIILTDVVSGEFSVGNFSTEISVLSTESGAPIADPVLLDGEAVMAPTLAADGTRAALYLGNPSSTGNTATSLTMVTIDLTTGHLLGSPVLSDGNMIGQPPVNSTSTRAALVAYTYKVSDYAIYHAYPQSTNIAIIDLATGSMIGALSTIQADATTTVFSADGNRLLISGYDEYVSTPLQRVVLINAVTGSVVTSQTFTGSGSAQLSADGSRVIVAASGSNSASTVTVLSTATGAQVGSTLNLVGGSVSVSATSADGSTIAIATVTADGNTTWVTVLDTVTGSQIGSAVQVSGGQAQVLLSADGSRAVVTTTANNAQDTKVTTLKIV